MRAATNHGDGQVEGTSTAPQTQPAGAHGDGLRAGARALEKALAAMHVTTTAGRTNAASRHAWVEARLAAVPAGSRILDAGAGEQRYRRASGHLVYVAQDFGRYEGRGDGAGLQTGSYDYGALDIVSDIASIPEPDGSFDVVLCTEVLEHVRDPLAAIREFARLLRSGGTLILTAPCCSLTHFAPYFFTTGFSRYFYETHLPEAGFERVAVEANGNAFEFLAQELRRLPDTASRYAGARLTLAERLAAHVVSLALERCSASGARSAELLCYGHHVLATRR